VVPAGMVKHLPLDFSFTSNGWSPSARAAASAPKYSSAAGLRPVQRGGAGLDVADEARRAAEVDVRVARQPRQQRWQVQRLHAVDGSALRSVGCAQQRSRKAVRSGERVQ
jgi:hypothetical protein